MRDYGFKVLDSNSQASDILYNIKSTKEIAITLTKPAGATELKRGTVLGIITASGKAAQFDDKATNGTQNVAGVLAETIEFGSGTEEIATMYVEGEFLWDALTAKTGAVIPVGLINNGIMIFKKAASSDQGGAV